MAKKKKPKKARLPGPFSHWVFKNKLVWFAIFFVVGVGLDQATKVWAQAELAVEREMPVTHNVGGELTTETKKKFVPTGQVEVIPKLFSLRYVENPAAAFSLTRNLDESFRRPFLVIFSLLALLGMAAWYFLMKKPDGFVQTAVALICSGAMGNLIDRVRLGYVIDFLDVYLGWIDRAKYTWPTFNIADSCIVIGAAFIVFRTFLPLTYEDDESEAEAKAVEAA